MTHDEAAASSSSRTGARRSVGRGVLLLLKIIAPVAVICGGLVFFQYMKSTRPEVARLPLEEKVHLVDTVDAVRTTVTPRLVLYGHIVAGREVELRPLVSGRVVRVAQNFADGGIVRGNDVLVEIDPFDYRIAVTERKSQLSEAEARLAEFEAELEGERALIRHERAQAELRQRDLNRRQALFERGAGTEKLLDDAKFALNNQKQRLDDRLRRVKTLEARINQQRAAITRAQGALSRAERNLRDTRLVAPFDGFLREISIEIGKKIGVNDKIARLTDAGRFEAKFQITDAQYGRLIREGKIIEKPATVVWKTAGRDFAFRATIARVSGLVSSASGGINLFAKLKGTDTSTLLRPGVFVEVTMNDSPYKNVFQLPDDSLRESRYVYVVAGERLEQRQVTVVGRVRNDVLVRGEIFDGDRVVVRAFPGMGPGVKVKASGSKADTPVLSRR